MCCFSGPVHVGGTKIFARATSPERQILVYSMSVEARDDVAMILPIPSVVEGIEGGEDAVRFLDMSGYPDFFTDMKRAFPEVQPPRLRGLGKGGMGGGLPKPMLAVHTVGAFEASFVPARDDFDRLDPRFRMPTVFWGAWPASRDYGFAVFKLRSSEEAQRIHPMAFEFTRRDRERLFFPTVHLHGPMVSRRAYFDHELYCQKIGERPRGLFDPWISASRPIRDVVDVSRTQGIVAADEFAYMLPMQGLYPNEDTWVVTS